MKKRRMGWILALSIIFSQNTGVWAEEPAGPDLLEAPGEEITLEELEANYQDRFIVKYKPESLFRLWETTTPADLTEAARQAYETALEAREQRIVETAVQQEAAAEEDSLSSSVQKMNMEKRASITAEEWKAGYLLFDLEEKIDPELFMSELKADPRIEYIQPDYELDLSDITLELEVVKDMAEGGAVSETPLPEEENENQAESITRAGREEETEAPKAIEEPEKTAGPTDEPEERTIKTAVIDGGVDITHAEFTERITDAWDFTADAELTYDESQKDQYYHGTHVAGIIAQTAPNVQIMPLRVFDQGRAYTSDIVEAIQYAEEHGAEIVNCSWGSIDHNRILKETIEESKMLFVCAAGNSRMNIDETPVYPAAFELDNVISTGALNPDQGFSYFSNYGNKNVDIAALGRNVESTWPGNTYGKMSGTSMAAAAVSGGAALAAQLGEENIKERVLETADQLSNLGQKVSGGRALNLANLTEGIPGEEKTVSPAEDFDVHGYQPTTAEIWEQFCALDNKQIAAGGDFTMVLKGDGTVYAWGDNTNGQLGVENQDASQRERAEPGQIPGLSGIIAVAAGPGYGLALKNDGTVYAWGDNAYGQLGNGTKTETYVPVQVTGLTGVTQISAGRLHGAAVTEDGSLYMWGNNNRGQLGDGTTEEHLTPVQISGLPAVYEAAAGGSHTVVSTDNGIYAWGDNTYGQLGDGTWKRRFSPVKTDLSQQIRHITAGLSHTAAVTEDGSVYTWGDNANSQLGNESGNARPRVVPGLPAVRAITAGEAFCAVITETGDIYTWGDNSYGQLGDGTKTKRKAPMQVAGLPAAGKIAAGKSHVAAIMEADDYIYTWGSNTHFQMGMDSSKRELSPVQAVGIDDAVTVAAGMYHSLAVHEDGTVSAWGYNNFGQLGNGTQANSDEPMPVSGLSDIRSVSAGGYHSLAVDNTGNVYGWGYSGYGQLATSGNVLTKTRISGLPAVKEVAAGAYHSMALAEDGTVYTWGRNEKGQLGDGTTTGRSTPRAVPGLTGVKSIAAGYYTSFAVLEDGRVMAWGNNKNNELGTNSYTDYYTPVEAEVSGVKEIAAGPYHTLALREDGALYSWGSNAQHQRTTAPAYGQFVACYYSGNIQAIAAGEYHSAFIKQNGTVTIVGKNTNGAYGNGTTKDYPTEVKDLTDAVDVAFGYGHGLAVRANGTIAAWGNNGSGQLGSGTRLTCKTPCRVGEGLSDTKGDRWEDAHEIDDDGSAASVLNKQGDQDWYTFTAKESRKYAIYTTGTADTYGALYTETGAAAGTPIAQNNDYNRNRNFKIVQELTAGQRYYVQVRGNTADDLGEYTLHISVAILNHNSEIIKLTKEADKTFTIAAKAKGVPSFADLAFNLTYDPKKMEIVNLTAQNFEKQSQPCQSGNVEIQSAAPGTIRFRMLNMPEEAGMAWSGVLNLSQFRFLGETGDIAEIQLDYVQEGGE